jgi:hypothetical protein
MKLFRFAAILMLLSGCAALDDFYFSEYYGDEYVDEYVIESAPSGCSQPAPAMPNRPALPARPASFTPSHETQEPPLANP